ncbi:MAG: FAD-binding oxidoreductase [bacterium]
MSDIVIIGGGIIGGAITYNLFERGFNGHVTVLEKNNQLAQESTSLSAGGFRNIWSTEVNLKLTNHSIKAFREFKDRLGINIGFEQIGYLFTYYEDDWQDIVDFKPVWDKNDVNTELIKPEDIRKLVPGFKHGTDHIDPEENEILNMKPIAGGLFGPDCGAFNPTTCATGYFEYTRDKFRENLDIKLNATVKKILIDSNNEVEGVKLINDEIITCKTVILAAGAWSSEILANSTDEDDYHLPVLPWKRQLFTVKMPKIEGFEHIPMTIIDNGVYFRPEAGNILAGRADNDQAFGFETEPDPHYYEEQMNYYMSARIPGMEYCRIVSKASMWGGLYAHNTKDKNAIIGYHPDIDNLFLATGFSGHGVMEAPAVGLAVSEKIMDDKYITIPEVEQLGFERIRENALIKETIVI